MSKLTRYENNFGSNGITVEHQEKLFNTKVLVMGAGSLGSTVIMNLCAMGIGQIKIIDDGIVQENDLNRQIIHKGNNIGRAKVLSAKDWINDFNRDIKVEVDKIKINELNYYNTILGYDIMVDCFDTYESKFILNEIAVRHNMVLIHGKASGFTGQVTTIIPQKTGCLACAIQKPFIFKPEKKCVLSSVASTIAGMQANEVLKIATGLGSPLLNRMVIFDGLKSEFRYIAYSKNENCRDCSKKEDYYELL